MVDTLPSFVEGEWRTGTGPGVPLLNPATEEVLGRADATGLDLGRALAFARAVGGPALRRLTFAERAATLARLQAKLHEAREALIDSSMKNGGCTRSDAKFDVDGAIGTLASYVELGKALGDLHVLADGEGVALGRGPRFWGQHVHVSRPGVALLVNAYNFPAWGFAEKAACALLAGMPLVFKPSETTAHTAHLVARAAAEVLPLGAFTFVCGTAHDLLDHARELDVLAFTGSARTGRVVASHPEVLARGVRVNVEADSVNSAVLAPGLELSSDAAQLFLREVAKDLTQKTGQKCTAVRRIFVPVGLADEVGAELSARFAEIKLGDPSADGVGMGPLVSAAQRARVIEGTARLLAEADPVFGRPGEPVAAIGVPAGRGFFHPIVLLRAKDGPSAERIHTEEVFGPVATLIPYAGLDDLAPMVAKGGGSLVTSVYGDDAGFVEAATAALAPFTGRLYLGSAKVADHTLGPGTVLPTSLHGGPGRAGGGEELGGLRGVLRYMQRTALQGFRPVVEKLSGSKAG